MNLDTHNFHLYIGSDARLLHPCDPENYGGQSVIPCAKMNISISEYHKVVMVQLMNKYRPDPVNEGGVDHFKLVLRPLSKMTEKEKKEYNSLHELRPSFSDSSSFMEREQWEINLASKKVNWLIKRGFDVGLIPEDKFILK